VADADTRRICQNTRGKGAAGKPAEPLAFLDLPLHGRPTGGGMRAPLDLGHSLVARGDQHDQGRAALDQVRVVETRSASRYRFLQARRSVSLVSSGLVCDKGTGFSPGRMKG
jgi:hypothetical protein